MFVVGGESLIDLISEPMEADGILRLIARQGGSPYNCAIALAKLGTEAGFLCPISSDGLGTYLLAPLAAAGVKVLIQERVSTYTTLAVVTFDANKSAQYGFYRQADRDVSRSALISALPSQLEMFQIGGFCPIESEDAAIWLDVAREAEARGATLSIDPNVRPSLIADFSGYRERLNAFLDVAHVVKVSIEDLAALEWGRTVRVSELVPAKVEEIIEKYTKDFLARGNCELVLVTQGEEGSRAFTRGAAASAAAYRPRTMGDTVGAGDTFMAAVLTLLSEQGNLAAGKLGQLDMGSLQTLLRFGAIAAGLNCAHVGCRPPTRAEVDAILVPAAQ